MSGPNPDAAHSISIGREKRRLLVIDIAAALDSMPDGDSTDRAEAILALITEKYRLETRRPPSVKDRERKKKESRVEVVRQCEKNELLIPQARNRRQEWTSREIEIASRTDLSDEEVAIQLGRTLFGVKTKRKHLRAGARLHSNGELRRWTGPELELIARKDLTTAEVAEMIGRTANAVSVQRHRLRIDPRKSNLAGLPRTDEQL